MVEKERVIDHPKLVSVETDSALYYFYPAVHNIETELPEELYDSIDAMVLENSAPYGSIRLWSMYSHNQWREMLLSNYRREKVPIYVVDIPYNERHSVEHKMLLADVLSSAIGIFLAVAFYPIGLLGLVLLFPLVFIFSLSIKHCIDGNEKLNYGYRHGYVLPSVMGYLFLTQFLNSRMGMRSVVAAEKLEEYVNKLAKDEVRDDRKPVILVEYGNLHLDIVPYLRHPHLRRSVLRIHAAKNYRAHDDSFVNQVLEYSFENLEPGRTAEFFVTKDGETVLERDESDEEFVENIKYTKRIYEYDSLPTALGIPGMDFLNEKLLNLLR